MATKNKKTETILTGKSLRASVAKAVTKAKETVTKAKATVTKATKAKPKAAPVVEVVDVTKEVVGALEQQAKAKRLSTKEAKAVKQAHGKEFAEALEKTAAKAEPVAVEFAPVVKAPVADGAEAKAADAVYGYAESLGIDIGDVVRIAKSCGEYAGLVEKAGMEITDRVVWLAGQKAREFDAKHVRPNSPTTGLSKTATANRGAAKGKTGGGKARVTVFGHAATAVIRALRATCGMGFAQIRNVLDAMGADSVADATIRAQMAGEGRKRGEPATLTAEQIEKAKATCVAVAV
jgi:hypothetical protein